MGSLPSCAERQEPKLYRHTKTDKWKYQRARFASLCSSWLRVSCFLQVGNSGKRGRGKGGEGAASLATDFLLFEFFLKVSFCPASAAEQFMFGQNSSDVSRSVVWTNLFNNLFYFILLFAAVTYNVFRLTLFPLLSNASHLIYVNVI